MVSIITLFSYTKNIRPTFNRLLYYLFHGICLSPPKGDQIPYSQTDASMPGLFCYYCIFLINICIYLLPKEMRSLTHSCFLARSLFCSMYG